MAVVAANALVDVNAVIEIHEIGHRSSRASTPWTVRNGKLSRTGSSMGAFVQICAWQFMQVLVGGMPAKFEVSTEV